MHLLLSYYGLRETEVLAFGWASVTSVENAERHTGFHGSVQFSLTQHPRIYSFPFTSTIAMSFARAVATGRLVARSSRFYSTPVAPAATRETAATPSEWASKRDATRAHAARRFSQWGL